MTRTLLAALISCLALGARAEDSAAPPAAARPLLATAPAASAAAPSAAADAEADDADVPDDEQIDAEVRAESSELEAVRAVEEQARPLEEPGDGKAARAAARLGLESPLRRELEETLSRDLTTPPEVAGRIPGLPEIDHDLRRLQAEFDIPVEVNDAVVAYVRFFQHPKVRKHFVKWLGRAPRYIPRFREILREEGLPEDTAFLAMIESGFANRAQSRARAVGPWQFIAATGKRMGLRQDFFVDERRDPEKSARAAARYLQELHGQLGDWRLAWAGYNAGAGKIMRAQRRGYQDFWSMARGKRVLKRETQGYVPKLMAAAIVTRHAEDFGFSRQEIEAEEWQPYELVTVPRATLLAEVARAADVPERLLLDLNPELRRTCTPPRPYALKVPRGQAALFASNWEQVSAESGKLAFAHHRVQRGEGLAAVAQGYGVPAATVQRMNGLRAGSRLVPGTELVIPLTPLARREVAAAVASEPPETRRSARAARSRPVPAPRTSPGLVETEGRTTVHVQQGDSLWAISQRFGVGLEQLCRWNGIRNPRRHRLQPGDELVVYAPGNTRPPTSG